MMLNNILLISIFENRESFVWLFSYKDVFLKLLRCVIEIFIRGVY